MSTTVQPSAHPAQRSTHRASRGRGATAVYLLLAVAISTPTAFALRPVLHVLDAGSWAAVVGGFALAIVGVVELVLRAVRR